jgi:sugar lactone lactonase YvrE
MQTILNRLTSPVRSLTAGTWIALFCLLTLCLAGAVAHAQQPIVVSSNTTLGYFPAGGQDGSQVPISDSFVVGANGHVIVTDEWGGDVLEINPTLPATSATTKLAALSNGGPTGIDQYGNVYVAPDGYSGSIFKLPYNAATGTYTGFTSAPTAACVGGTSDTAPCIYAANFATTVFTSGSGYADLVFDGSGNLFIATSTVPTNNPNSIYECNASCQTGSGAPTLIYADANPIGALAVDPWANLFFSDGANGSKGVTNLNEIPYQSGKYASTPTVLESYTNKASYGNGFSGVAVNGTGTIFFATNADGIFAIPNTQSGGPNLAGTYAVGMGGGYAIALDPKGNVYEVHYVGSPPSGDANYGVDQYLVNNVPLGATTIGGTATTASVNILDSNGSCTPTITATPKEFGVTTTEFTVTPGSSCGAVLGTGNGTISPALALAGNGAAISGTITFNPTAAGERNAALVIADSTNSASGVAALTGVGQAAAGNVDPGVSTAYTTGLTGPASVIADAAGDLFIADSGAAKVYEIATGSSTPVAIGTGFVNPTALAFDANGNLFIGDDGVPAVIEIANTGTTGAFVAGTQSTVVSTKATPGGTAFGSVMGIAVGPRGSLLISDTANKRVISYNPLNGQASLPLSYAVNGITSPMGIAVDSSSNLYVADSSLNEVFVLWATGGVTTITPPNVTQAVGVAVDASGSLLVADRLTGNIVRIPNLSGTLTTAQAVTIETVAPQASSLWMNFVGNIYAAGGSGKSANVINRTAAAISLGTVQDGVTNSGTVVLMNAGNAAATLGSPDVTQPTNTMFTLNPATTNGCSSGSSGPPGALCQFTATFAPPVGTPNGAQSGTATINITTPSVAFTVSMSGTATASSILPQTITNFNPPTTLQVGQQITLSATGGASGNPVTFSIDASSACPTCATINGTKLTAVGAGSIKVDANQAAGNANGNQYAAAPQVQAPITIQNTLVGAGVPALLMNQANWLLALPNGGAFGGTAGGGTTFVVNPAGNPVVGTSYGSRVYLYNLKTAAWTLLGTVSNVAGLAQDSAGNLYLSDSYNGTIAKLPYNSSTNTYATLSDFTSTAPPACTGSDTAECTVGTGFPGYVGVGSMTMDASGNLFIATDDQGTYAPHSIWECSAACQTGASAPVMLYQETATSVTIGANTYTIAYYIGGMAVDPWRNLFFADSALVSGGSNESAISHLNELVYTAGKGYAATPTVIQTFTNTKPGGYDDELDGVGVTSNGTIYYGLQYDGVFGIPNTQAGGPVIANQFGVLNEGVKEIALDSNGNVYWVSYYSGGDTLGQGIIGDLTTPNAQYQGAPVSASATVIDNAFTCGTAATVAIASSNSEFGATAGTTCSGFSVSSGNGTLSTPISVSSYPATITFTATKPATQTATLTVSDTTNGGVGTATVTGFALTTPQTLTYTAPTTTTFTYSPTLTVTVSVTNGGSNNPAAFTVDSSSTGAGTFSSTTVTGTTSTATLTVTQAGSIVIDANEAGGLVKGIYYDNATQAQLTLTINQASQAIVFPQPTSPVTYAVNPNTTVSLSANGGASGNPVQFSVDPSSTGAGTVSSTTLSNGTSSATLTVTGAGNIVIDATQAGTVNYQAAPQVQQTIVVNQAAQTITFTPLTQPFHYIASCNATTLALCATVSIQATGGGSNNAIVLTPDAKNAVAFTVLGSPKVSGATTTAVIALPPSQNLTFPASLIMDANQPGNTNYLAATQAQFTISVQKPLPIQTITFSQPQTQVVGTQLTLSATASSGFPVSYAASPTTICTVNGSAVTFVAASTSTTGCTIMATQGGDNIYFAAAVPVSVTFAVNAAGQAPSLNMSLSLSSLTIEPGTVGLAQITITSQNNFAASTVSFSCSGVPSGYSCSFNPTSTAALLPIAASGLPTGATATTTLTVTPPASAAVVRPNLGPLFPATLAVALCFLSMRKRNRLFVILLVVVLLAGFGMLSGCGGSSGASTGPATTSTITVTATGGGTSTSSNLTIIYE